MKTHFYFAINDIEKITMIMDICARRKDKKRKNKRKNKGPLWKAVLCQVVGKMQEMTCCLHSLYNMLHVQL